MTNTLKNLIIKKNFCHFIFETESSATTNLRQQMDQKRFNEISIVSCANLNYYNIDNNTFLEIQDEYFLKIGCNDKNIMNIKRKQHSGNVNYALNKYKVDGNINKISI